MLLRNFDFATKYLDLKSKNEVEKTSPHEINGWYKFIDGLLTALFVSNNSLYFIFGNNEILILDSHRVSLKEINGNEKEFNLINGSDLIARFLYRPYESGLNVSPFEYIEEDDFKWEEFISKIINDKERQRNFVVNLMRRN